MNSTMERPQYPRTQYNHQNRSHMTMEQGLSQQSLTQPQNNSLAQTPEHPYGGYDANFWYVFLSKWSGEGGVLSPSKQTDFIAQIFG